MGVRISMVMCTLGMKYIRERKVGKVEKTSKMFFKSWECLREIYGFTYLYAPEGCQYGTHTNGTAYTRGTYSRARITQGLRVGELEPKLCFLE